MRRAGKTAAASRRLDRAPDRATRDGGRCARAGHRESNGREAAGGRSGDGADRGRQRRDGDQAGPAGASHRSADECLGPAGGRRRDRRAPARGRRTLAGAALAGGAPHADVHRARGGRPDRVRRADAAGDRRADGQRRPRCDPGRPGHRGAVVRGADAGGKRPRVLPAELHPDRDHRVAVLAGRLPDRVRLRAGGVRLRRPDRRHQGARRAAPAGRRSGFRGRGRDRAQLPVRPHPVLRHVLRLPGVPGVRAAQAGPAPHGRPLADRPA